VVLQVDHVENKEWNVENQKHAFKKALIALCVDEGKRQHREQNEHAVGSADRRNINTKTGAKRLEQLDERCLLVGWQIKKQKKRAQDRIDQAKQSKVDKQQFYFANHGLAQIFDP
jgi:hypothetical protein